MKIKYKNTEGLTTLLSQSSFKYSLLKDETTKLYYIKRLRDSKMALVGDNNESYEFILYGIEANQEDLTQLIFE